MKVILINEMNEKQTNKQTKHEMNFDINKINIA